MPLHSCLLLSHTRHDIDDFVRYRVGVFSTLTNSYAIVAIGASENFYRYDAYIQEYKHVEPVADAASVP